MGRREVRRVRSQKRVECCEGAILVKGLNTQREVSTMTLGSVMSPPISNLTVAVSVQRVVLLRFAVGVRERERR